MNEHPDNFFARRHVVVTGAGHAGQVGESITRIFAELGAVTILVDRKLDNSAARANELIRDGFTAHALGCDLSEEKEVTRLAADITSICGNAGLAALVNGAGGFSMTGNVANSTVDGWQRQFTINLTTCFLTTRALLPLLRVAKGSVVNFATAGALLGQSGAGMSAYMAAKSGVIALTRALAREEAPHGVRVNAVAPTAVRTATNVQSMGDAKEYVEREEVARAVLFLCSPEASAISGEIIRLA